METQLPGLTIRFTNLPKPLEFLGMIRLSIGILLLKVTRALNHLIPMTLFHIGLIIIKIIQASTKRGIGPQRPWPKMPKLRPRKSMRLQPLPMRQLLPLWQPPQPLEL
ncbi:putative transmembrane protein [Lasius neglectus virus 1]|uniref:Putative transmembrane protein n=1 Tax=Lasius neglectus virus 1 TaxID=2018501 RepID=A0A220QTF5_9VIRU|nr:putative transmembrane protein [Lasius neglectus virus 1]ASK12196.1 putative transmembrane protein [Lasius neglectus virus 1]